MSNGTTELIRRSATPALRVASLRQRALGAFAVFRQTPDGSIVRDWHEQQYRYQVSDSSPTTGLVHMPFFVTMTGGVRKLGVAS